MVTFDGISVIIGRMSCPHETFTSDVSVHRLADASGVVRNYMAEVTVKCEGCGQPFRFLGPGVGLSFSKPTVNLPATTLHVPIAPGERSIDEVPASIKVEVA